MRKFIGFGMLFTLLVTVALTYFYSPGEPDLASFQQLVNPVITDLPNQHMLEVVVQGDPADVTVHAYDLLYSSYMKLDGIERKDLQLMPHTRWEADPNAPRSTWTGHFALPIPNSTGPKSAPQNFALQEPQKTEPENHAPLSNPKSTEPFVRETVWQYGPTAQILHIGPYEQQHQTLTRLREHIQREGYETSGVLEEIYLKGPGLIFRGDPATYQTLLRLPVRREGSAQTSQI